jgi:hypothetical protein
MKIFILSLLLFWNVFALAEEIEYKAKHGGIIKKTENTFLEIVHNNDKTDIYITGHDHRNIADKELSLSAIAQVNGKNYPVTLKLENDHYSASPANSYLHKENNFVLMLTISFSGTVDRATVHLGRNMYP